MAPPTVFEAPLTVVPVVEARAADALAVAAVTDPEMDEAPARMEEATPDEAAPPVTDATTAEALLEIAISLGDERKTGSTR